MSLFSSWTYAGRVQRLVARDWLCTQPAIFSVLSSAANMLKQKELRGFKVPGLYGGPEKPEKRDRLLTPARVEVVLW